MASNFYQLTSRAKPDRSIVPGLVIMAVAVFVGLMVFALNSDIGESFPYFFMLPWLFALAIVLLTPTVILYYRGKFTIADPLMFATWGYFFPAFVIGGTVLAAGWSQPYYLSFIQDAEINLPWTLVLIMLGFAGLSIGYFLPVGHWIGKTIEHYLPKRDYEPSAYVVPGLALMVLGFSNFLLAIFLGVLGFQRAEELNSYDGIVILTSFFWLQASFLLWYIVFREWRITTQNLMIIGLLLVTALGKAVLTGNRGSLIQIFVLAGLAYFLAGRKMNFKQGVIAAALLMFCLVAGMIYGSTFRNVKGTQATQSVGEYTDNIAETFDKVGTDDNLETLTFGVQSLADRLDTVSSLAVVVSSYEQLAPYEESYGLDNNIWKDLSTFFVPRLIWNDKPVASDPHKYSDLYFNYEENAFAITSMGDLLRNYGVAGVLLGMIVLGIILRTIYRGLVDEQPRIIWRAMLYFMLLTSISYEGFYGYIIPLMVKVGIAAVVGVIIANFIAKRFSSSNSATPAH